MNKSRDNDAFARSVERIYAEHLRIMERVAHLQAVVQARRPDEMRSALRFLMGDLVEHWASEEQFMAEVDYPELGDHRQLHELIQDRVMEARQAGVGSTSRLAEAARALARAVEEHVRSDDARLGEFVAARERLRAISDGPDPGAALDLATAEPALLLSGRGRGRGEA